jgi:uncharacterized protein
MVNQVHAELSHTDICLYLDFYGQLLTSRSREVLELYYGDDLSLSEIAEALGITRQAVHDRLRQGARLLDEYEKALGLSGRFRSARRMLQQAIEALDGGHADQARTILKQLESEL